MDSSPSQLDQFIDLQRYPIDQLDSESGQALLAHCHQMMSEDTICVLPGFLRPTVVDALATEIADLESVARPVDYQATLYGWMDNSGFPADHPRSRLMRRHCSIITTEQIKPDGHCLKLFQLDPLTEFIRRLLGYETLYRSACPNISVRVNMMDDGEEFGWHYDTNDGVVSFVTQNADQGGVFEYVPLIRSEEDENYTQVSRILSGDDQPKQLDVPPGSFILFLGRRSLHRVSLVGATSRRRQSLLFSYDRKPNMVFPERIRKRLTEPSGEPFLGVVKAAN